MVNKVDELFDRITAEVIAQIEDGAKAWEMPWVALGGNDSPVNVNGRSYRGLNAFWLAMQGASKGYDSGVWGTYKAWSARKAQVRKGEKGTPVLFWKPTTYEDKVSGEEKRSLIARTYVVFAAEQCDGAEKVLACRQGKRAERNTPERIAEAESYFTAIGVKVRHGGDSASYSPGMDMIRMPELDQFTAAESYYGTLAHEHVHWSGHGSRLDRREAFGNRFGSEAYAAEELVAELGAAFFTAQMGLSAVTREDHAGYLSHWLKVLREVPKALLTVTSKAQAALDFLNEKAGYGVSAEEDDQTEMAVA